MSPIKPSPAMAKAITEALQVFTAQWPRVQSLSGWYHSAEKREDLIVTWARACVGITVDAIPDAARRWLADPQHIISSSRLQIPNPATFAKYARGVDRQYYRATVPVGPKPAGLPGRAHDFGRRAYQELGSWAAVSLVNDELLRLAPDADAERRIREHRIGLHPSDPWPRVEHFDEAVRLVKARLALAAEQNAQQRVPA